MVSLHTHRVGKRSSTIMSGCHYLSPHPPPPTSLMSVFLSPSPTFALEEPFPFRNTLLLPFYLLVFVIPAAAEALTGPSHGFYLLREVVSSSLRSSTDSIL